MPLDLVTPLLVPQGVTLAMGCPRLFQESKMACTAGSSCSPLPDPCSSFCLFHRQASRAPSSPSSQMRALALVTPSSFAISLTTCSQSAAFLWRSSATCALLFRWRRAFLIRAMRVVFSSSSLLFHPSSSPTSLLLRPVLSQDFQKAHFTRSKFGGIEERCVRGQFLWQLTWDNATWAKILNG